MEKRIKIGILVVLIATGAILLTRYLRRKGRVVATLDVDGVEIRNVIDELERDANATYLKRDLNQIDKIIVHHSATSSGSPWSYARYHVRERGWPGIGYHYVVQKDGTIYQTQKWETISYHTSGENSDSIGIVLTGDYDKEQPPPEQLQAAGALVRYLRRNLGDLRLNTHNQYAQKSCPGGNVNINQIENYSQIA